MQQQNQAASAAQAPPLRPSTSHSPPQSSSSGAAADNEAEPQPVRVDDDIGADNPFEHWASPAELLQMRALWADVIGRHRNEIENVQSALHRVSQERDALVREVHDVDKLRQLYATATMEFERIKAERDAWREEREMLVLRLRKMSNEMEASRAAAATTNDTRHRELQATVDVLQAENTKLAEALSRTRQTLTAERQRFGAEKTTLELSNAALEQRVLMKDHELQLQRKSSEDLKTTVVELQAANSLYLESQTKLKIELLTLERAHQMEVEKLKGAHEDEVATLKSTWSQTEADLIEKVRVLQQKLDDECELYTTSREQLAAALTAAMASKARAVEEAEASAHALEAQLQEARAIAHGRTQQHADELRARSQAVEMLTSQLSNAELARAELAHEKALLSARLADTTTQLHAAKVELERAVGECQRVALQNIALHGEVDARRKLESERDAYKLRAETLEGDIKAQLTFYENQMQQSYATIQVMQERHRHEREMLMAKVTKRRRETVKKSDATASAKRSEAAPLETTSTAAAAAAAPAAEPVAKITLNALEVLRQSEKAAEQLSRTVGF